MKHGRIAALMLAAALLAACESDSGQGIPGPPFTIESPDGQTELTVDRPDPAPDATGAEWYLRAERRGVEYLGWSPLGIEYEDAGFFSELEPVTAAQNPVQETYRMLAGKRSVRSVAGSELALKLQNAEGHEIELLFRAHDDGIAYRYRRPGTGQALVTRELSGFQVPEGADAWIQPYDKYIGSWPGYERAYNRVTAGDDESNDGLSTLDDGWGYPALFGFDDGAGYLLLTEAGLDQSYCATRFEQQVDGTLYRVRFPSAAEGNGEGQVNPTSTLPWATPWRVALLGKLSTIVESTLVDDLSQPPEQALEEYESWVRPGRAAWSWWSQDTGTPALQEEYVDFAAEHGWEYVLVDAGWDRWPAPETEVPALVDYVGERGVGVLLWYNSGGPHNNVTASPRDRMHDAEVRRAELDRIAGWGVRGIKVDFFVSDKQDRITQYLEILDAAAERELMVNFHGCTLPRGWQRSHPNLMTMEAVAGGENYRTGGGPDALHNVRLAFTRNVVGSMDYTPMTFEAALNNVGIPYAHQLALAVIFESGWQHLADRADSDVTEGFRAVFAAFPFVDDFLSSVPTAWDDTRFLAGDPDSLVALARRKGDEWYLAAINGLDRSRELTLALGFLDSGSYGYRLIHSGAAPDALVEDQGSVTAADSLTVTLDPRDGFGARLSPE